ncbi:MAG: AraC family transcriptional regulator, partial [Proteobacteria bacterium]|nr:AraC family transcriptional regulator [Pseudomonadota bacterium]
VNTILSDPDLQDWVRAMSTRVRRLVSVCTGACLLAKAGLLDGRRATTHWAFCDRLAADYPKVRVEPDRIFIRDDPISTSGGVTSGIDLALSLVEEDWGQEQALGVARYLVMFLKRPGGQSQFSGYLVSEATKNQDLRKLQMWIMEHPSEDLHVEALAARMAMSARNFARVFQAETGMTPAKFVEKARIDAARHLLGVTDHRIDNVAVMAGFGDPERMRRAFIRHLGVNPQDYRARFRLHGVKPVPTMTQGRAAVHQASLNAL